MEHADFIRETEIKLKSLAKGTQKGNALFSERFTSEKRKR
jgi:hypothetical protein